MRRYGYAGYGGYGNEYPDKGQPLPFQTRPRGDLAPQLVPPDVAPRRPSGRLEVPQIIPDDPMVDRVALAVARRLEKSVVPNYDGLRFAEFQQVNVFVPAGESLLILPKPTTTRVYLRIGGIAVEGAGVMNVAFGRPATANDAFFDPFSTQPYMEWTYSVPQSNIYGFTTARTFQIVFAELDPRVANDLAQRSTVPQIVK